MRGLPTPSQVHPNMQLSDMSEARVFVKTTVLAGMLIPIAKVSVEKRTLMRDS